MKHPTLRRAVMLALALAAVPTLGAGAASASTWTVDDDKAQCPSAGFTTIQAAVDQAAPHDTIVVCDGTYLEQSTPPNSATQDPAQAGSMNGLTITKPLTIKGTGASKVTIMPATALGATLAGTVPYLRDGGGNVVTVSRQSLGSTDANENFVDISGVTIASPTAYVEAGVAFFNTSGRIANSTIGPLKRAADSPALAAAPHGWGVIMTNSLQGAEAGVRRELTVQNSLITGYQSGGILFDDGRGADGAATTTQRSGITEYGSVTGSRIVGSGASTVIPQTGVQYSAGARGSVTATEIANNRYSSDLRQSVGLLLTDVAAGQDPQGPAGQQAFSASAVSFSGNGYAAFNATAANDAVRTGAPAPVLGSWFGCVAGPLVGAPSSFSGASNGCQGVSGDDTATPAAASIALGTPLTAAPAALSVPGATADAKPTGRFVTGDFTVAPGQAFTPVVGAADDFGVKRVNLLLDGTIVATKGPAPYVLTPAWTPTADDAGTHTLTAQVVDSAGQVTTTAPTTLTVLGTPLVPFTADAGSWAAGAIAVGATASQRLMFTNNGDTALRIGSVAADGAAFGVTGGSCAAGKVVAGGGSCSVDVAFTPATAGAATGTLTVTPAGAPQDAASVALTGTGVAPEAATPPATTPPATTTPSPAPAPKPAPKPPARTATVRVGALTAALLKAPKLTTTGTLKLGTLTCAKACTVKVRGHVTAGGRRLAVSTTLAVKAGGTATLTLRPSPALRQALKKAGKGTLSVRLTVGTSSKVVTLKVTA
jgi:hypothetical protein